MGGWILTALLAMGLARAECPELEDALRATEAALLQVDMEQAHAHLARTEDALACSAAPSGEDLARFWLLLGATAAVDGDEVLTELAFAAANRSDPAVWYPSLGGRLEQLWRRAGAVQVENGTLTLSDDRGMVPWIDGHPITFPTPVPAGVHLAQLFVPGPTARAAQVVRVGEGETVEVVFASRSPTPLPTPTTATVANDSFTTIAPARRSPARISPWLIGGITAAALSGGAAIAAVSEKPHIRDATTADEVTAAHRRQVGFGVSSYVLAGVAATGVVLHFAL